MSYIVKPRVEYVIPDVPNTVDSERSDVKLKSFPPHRPSAESTLKPSSVHQLERHVTSKRGLK